ncbi:integrin alpha-6 isoform X2 [Melanotaenia boesemani]|uniref:integrin alpha-6 isoform X2 n=1 Tax=Melanotaenia boesemani TaxID=1250792 RepID=UPI001C03C5D6|nr:integrin alpha-6 isoform X2 [Melanotaenia boesemani]
MLLIGSPKARALERQRSNITGGLYKCEVTQSNHCERIDFDNEEDTSIENKEDQWMGVTVQSQGPGGKIVTCAHRYQTLFSVNTPLESHDIIGRCYVFSQDLTIDTSDEDGGNWKMCEGRARGHEMFGLCQQGLAATFTKDYHYVVFGAPGAQNWKGIVRVEQKNNTLLDMGVYDDGPYETGTEQTVPVSAHSYLGFSLETGHNIMIGGGLTVVAGAPRANHRGAVVLLRKGDETSTMLWPEHILYGPGLASSFGYDVAVADLNSDGWQDIIVGAPQFYMKDRDIGGAVYVYINNAGKWENVTPVRLNGTKDSMFGLAVENIGDINKDSYQDIAVGAPHDDGGAGRVYIYHGSAQGIQTKPAQVLSGKQHNIQFFGYSLAGNMDLDSNSYPDLAVGSLSDAALIYRARPVIRISTSVITSLQEIDLAVKNCGDSICFNVTACFSYKASHASYNSRLTISYLVEADGDRRKQGLTSRVMFLSKSHTESDYLFNGTINLQGQNLKNCDTIKVRLKDNIKDKMRSIPIMVSAEMSEPKRPRNRNGLPQLMPILDMNQPSKNVTKINFIKEGCSKDHVCRSNLKMKYSLHYRQKSQDPFPSIESRNNIPEYHLNYDKKDLALKVTVNNMKGDDAYEAKLVGRFPDTLSYSGVRLDHSTTNNPLNCDANHNGSEAECELGNPFKKDSEITFYIILNTDRMTLNTTDLEIDLKLQTTSDQKDISHLKVKLKVIIELPLSVSIKANPNHVSFGGVVKGESAMKTDEEIGSLINYTFTINNLWKSLGPSVRASLHIHWPKSNKDGKWLLYLVKISSNGPEKIHCTPESEINPLKLKEESSMSLAKQDSETKGKNTGSKISYSKIRNKVLSCENEIKCVVLKCPLQGLDGTEMKLRSRLWNSTFIEEYANFPTVQLVVKASLELHTQAPNMILRSPYTNVTVYVSPDREVAQYSGVPWWIILLAALAGILILALMVFLLWRCGFFKRATKEQFAAYHQAKIHVQPSDKDNLCAEA